MCFVVLINPPNTEWSPEALETHLTTPPHKDWLMAYYSFVKLTSPLTSNLGDFTLISMEQVHASCIEIDSHGVLLRGPSGSGKSDLSLRLINQGGHLVADDYTMLEAREDHLLAAAPPATAGIMEVRGLGLLKVGGVAVARVRLIVDLVPPEEIERMPQVETETLRGIVVSCLKITPFEASAPAKIRMALRCVTGTVKIVQA